MSDLYTDFFISHAIPLIAYYKLGNISTNLIDETTNYPLTIVDQANMSLQNSLISINSGFNSSVLFNGGYGNGVFLNIANKKSITFQFYIKTTASSGEIIKKQSSVLIELYQGKIKSTFTITSGTLVLIGNTVINNDNIYQISIEFNEKTGISLYINNNLDSSIGISPSEYLVDPGFNLYLGNFIGILDELAIINSVVSKGFVDESYYIANQITFTPTKTYSMVENGLAKYKSPNSIYYGNGKIWGYVKDINNNPLKRRVALLEHDSHILIDDIYSNESTGYYEFININEYILYTVIYQDIIDYRYNDIIRAKISPELM